MVFARCGVATLSKWRSLMIDGIRLKICGLTTLVDAEFADRAGADHLGFILHPASPRYLPLSQYRDMAPRLPVGRKRVAVMVEPTEEKLEKAAAAGFDRFQIHHRFDLPGATLAAWSEQVGRERLWLAPKLPPGAELSPMVFESAHTVLVDTYRVDGFGGTGRTGDWPRFAQWREQYPDHTWVLAGGLGPDNIAAALVASGANFVDVSSGVEAAPGVKDHAKLRALVLAIHRARS